MYSKRQLQALFLLQKEFGIGLYRARFLLSLCGISYSYNITILKFKRLKYLFRVKKYLLLKQWLIQDSLKRRRSQYFSNLRNLKTYYKFLRLKFGLPLRGQRTHSNRQNSRKLSIVLRFLSTDSNVFKKKKKYFKKKKKYFNLFLVKKKKHYKGKKFFILK